MAKPIARYLLIVIAGLLAGCIGPRPSVMPETKILFLVLDAESGLPVPAASAYMIYDGPSGEQNIRGPFASDEAGRIDFTEERSAVGQLVGRVLRQRLCQKHDRPRNRLRRRRTP